MDDSAYPTMILSTHPFQAVPTLVRYRRPLDTMWVDHRLNGRISSFERADARYSSSAQIEIIEAYLLVFAARRG